MTDITIVKGSTFSRVLRWEAYPLVYKPITVITRAGPAVVTASGHGLVDGWRATVVSAGGMSDINAASWPPKAKDFHKVTYVDANRVSFNDVNAEDFAAYTVGGSLVYYTPVSLSGFTARLQIRLTAKSTGDPLVTLVSPTDIVLDDVNHTITVVMDATATAALTFSKGAYDLELASAGGVVTKLLSGSVVVTDEVTR